MEAYLIFYKAWSTRAKKELCPHCLQDSIPQENPAEEMQLRGGKQGASMYP